LERASLLTPHMKAMGLLDSARIMSAFTSDLARSFLTRLVRSWHLSISSVYLPAWVIVALLWSHRVFTASNTGLILLVHLLLGLSLASWSFFVATPFKKSPQLAAVASTFLAILLAILALVFGDVVGTRTASVLSLVFPPVFYIYAIRVICAFEGLGSPTNVLQGDPDNDVQLLPLIVVAIVRSALHFNVTY
jgi:ATP-binding cassette subfamily A (ABC1) protein 3